MQFADLIRFERFQGCTASWWVSYLEFAAYIPVVFQSNQKKIAAKTDTIPAAPDRTGITMDYIMHH